MKQVLATGVIRSPYGVRGFVKVCPYADDFSHFFNLKRVSIRKNERQRQIEIEGVKNYNGELLVKFVGIDTPEDAKLISGWEIEVSRDQASKLARGEVYTADLLGMVLLCDNEKLGEVVSVIEGAQALLLEVKCSDSKNRIVPFLKGIFVDDLDLEAGTMRLLRKDLVQ